MNHSNEVGLSAVDRVSRRLLPRKMEIPAHSEKGSPLDTQYLGATEMNEALSQRWHPS